ncbi:MAG: cupredoxin domain-containing protein [Sporichthyaceae bacterium]
MAGKRAVRGFAVAAVLGAAVLVPQESASAASTAVSIKDYSYQAETVAVSVGDTVRWTNKDLAMHDVTTSKAPVKFASKLLKKGQSFSYTFTKPGVYEYFCSPHPNMVAKVVVK